MPTISTTQGQGFNPRPCVRGDTDRMTRPSGSWMFQSTPLREGRPAVDLTA